MKKVETKEPETIKYCDSCGKKCRLSCPKCDRDWCAECIHRGKGVIGFWNTVYGGGFVCAAYCVPCELEVRADGGDELYQALLAIHLIRAEVHDFGTRAKAAELELRRVAKRLGVFA